MLEIKEYKVYDLKGKIILNSLNDDKNINLQLHKNLLTKGIYFLKITTKTSQFILKFINF